MLLNKKKKGIQGLNITSENLQDLSSMISEETRARWSRQEEDALRKANGFFIYDVDIDKGVSTLSSSFLILS